MHESEILAEVGRLYLALRQTEKERDALREALETEKSDGRPD